MLSENQVKRFSIISIAVAVIFCIAAVFYIPEISDGEAAEESTSSVEDVLDKNSVMDINIEISEDDWQWLLDNATEKEYRCGNVTINGETFYNVGIKPKGNSSLTSVAEDDTTDRYSLKIKFNEYVKGQTYHGIEQLALNNNISDATYMKEYLSYDMYKLLGVAVPEYEFSHIKINGDEWGLYLAVEIIGQRFIEKNYGTSEGNLYKPETMDMVGGKGNMQNQGAGNENKQNNMAGGAKDMQNPPNGDGAMIQNNGGENAQNGMNPPDMNNKDGENIQSPADNDGNGSAQQNNAGGNAENGMNPPDMNDKGGENIQSPADDTSNGGGQQNNAGGNLQNGKNSPDMKDKGGMMGQDTKGADLKYIDDNVSSYSTVTDSAVLKTTSEKDYEKIVSMIKNLNNGENLEECLNVDEILKYFAVNTFLVNLDSYSGGMYHNYYLYEKDGVFEILPWDLNMSFAGFQMNDASKAVNFPIDSPVSGELEDAPLIGKLLEVEEYKEKYHEYLKELCDYVNSGSFEESVKDLNSLISDYVKEDATAFYTYDEYEAAYPELINFTNDRTTSILAQLEGSQPSEEYGTVSTSVNLSAMGGQMGGNGHPNEGNALVQNNDDNGGNMNQPVDMNNDDSPQNASEIGGGNGNMQAHSDNMKNGGIGMGEAQKSPSNGNFLGDIISEYAIPAAGLCALMLGALIFVIKFKRKRY